MTMNAELQKTCELFIKNRDILHDNFRWDGNEMHLVGSAIITGDGKTADADALKKCEEIIKEKTGFFSAYRGNAKIAVMCRMAESEDPEGYLDRVIAAAEKIAEHGRMREEIAAVAGMVIADANGDLTDKAESVYSTLSADKRYRNSSGVCVLAAMIACSGKDPQALLSESDACYERLADTLPAGYLASLSLVLAMDGRSVAEKCDKTKELFLKLRDSGKRFGSGEEISILGLLSALDMNNDEIVSLISEADTYLRAQKGFGMFGCGPTFRRMYAAILVMDTFMKDDTASGVAAAHVVESAVDADFIMLMNLMAVNVLVMNTSILQPMSADK